MNALSCLLPLVSALAMVLAFAAHAAESQTVALGGRNTLNAQFRIGETGRIAIEFRFASGPAQALMGIVGADELMVHGEKDGRKTAEIVEKRPMPNARITFQGAGLRFDYHSRPFLKRYKDKDAAALAEQWDALPAADERWLALQARTRADGTELWLDGRYCGWLSARGALTDVVFKLESGGGVREARASDAAPVDRYLPLDVRQLAAPETLPDARLPFASGTRQIGDVPFLLGDGAHHADVGMAKECQGLQFLEDDPSKARTAFDGMKESLHWSVPVAFYHRAWVLCAVAPDAKKDTMLTVRLTRFAKAGRGGAIADTSVTLPRADEKPAIEGMTRAGDLTPGEGGQKLPLWLVPVDLKCGEILDLLGHARDASAALDIGPYLDVEVLGTLGGISVQRDFRHTPVAGAVSAVQVFGLTLEIAPVELRLQAAQPGNIFHNDEAPETTVVLRAVRPGRYEFRHTITGADGARVREEKQTVEFQHAGEELRVPLSLAMPDLGWYGLRLELAEKEKTFLAHDAAFALLGKDTRKAGYESPFGTWWFNGIHLTTASPEIAGPLLFKAGLRQSTFKWTKTAGEAELAPWRVGLNQISWPFRIADLKDWPAAEARAEKDISDTLRRFPHCRFIDIFHESYDPGAVPPELYGGSHTPTADQQARDDQLFELGVKAARFVRAKFPQLKIIAGNSGGSSGIVAMMLRKKFPRELIDYLGSETTGQTIAPEKLTPHSTGGINLLAETARHFGYGDVRLAGCFEYTSRAERDLTAQLQAEWYVKDTLIGLAHRFPCVSPAGLEDVGGAYYQTLWGASGLCQRAPLSYPKPAYVALATLTRALDSARLVNQMPTGSASAFALEFERAGGRAYAVWTTRGQCEMTFTFPRDTDVNIIGFHGRTAARRTRERHLKLDASSAALYVISPIAATQVLAGRWAHPPPASPITTRIPMNGGAWALGTADAAMTKPDRRAGHFLLSSTRDDEQADCLELELQKRGDVPVIVGEHTALRLSKPQPVSGQPHSVGVLVRGDSSGGHVYFELQDAKGELWISCGGIDGGDWGNQAALDFDGWRTITFPLTLKFPQTHIEPNPGIGQWVHRGGDGVLDFPLSLVGLDILTFRQSYNLARPEPVRVPLRFKEIVFLGE